MTTSLAGYITIEDDKRKEVLNRILYEIAAKGDERTIVEDRMLNCGGRPAVKLYLETDPTPARRTPSRAVVERAAYALMMAAATKDSLLSMEAVALIRGVYDASVDEARLILEIIGQVEKAK